MDPVRIATVQYLNTAPLIEGLEKTAGVDLIHAAPSRIIDLIAPSPDTSPDATTAEPQADVGLISIIDAARSKTPLALLPVGMIGCDGPTLTVRIFSRVPLNEITELHTDTDSHTSAALAQVILNKSFGIKPRITDFDAHERMSATTNTDDPDAAWPESVLLIGDKVVTGAPAAVRAPHQLDLGEAWKELTGLPFAYAVWACRAEDANTRRVQTAAALLDRLRRRNAQRIDAVISARAAAKRWPDDLARKYLGQLLRYEVSPREREAVATFLAMAAELGLCDSTDPVWSEPTLEPTPA